MLKLCMSPNLPMITNRENCREVEVNHGGSRSVALLRVSLLHRLAQ